MSRPVGRGRLRRLLQPFQEFGWAAGLLYVIDRVLSRVSARLRLHCYELMVQPIRDTPMLPPRFAQHFQIREIKRGDPEIALMPARPEIKESRFAQHAVCLGAYRKGQLIGYLWFCFGAYEEDEVRCTYVLQPPAQSVFDFDLYIFPEHRMSLAFAAIWDGANAYLHGRGIRFTFSRLSRFNLSSRNAHEHLGWKCVGRALFLQAFRVEVMATTLFPYLGVSLRHSRVRLLLTADVLRP